MFFDGLSAFNDILWHQSVLFVLLGVGILFTVWSGFGQYRALTHGVQVIRGKYDEKGHPGAINHFQALSTALSATVGLGNIAGVALAISVGGPGAVFWMWVTGFVGMALKLTEVTQAMLFRDTTDPENPRGGAMWVCKRGFAAISPSLAPLGTVVGGIFCVTLVISCVTGGNMFQAYNVADIGFAYFGIPKVLTGVVLGVGVGAVIVGGIKRIGDIAGMLVPGMCALYLLAGSYVLVTEITQIPAMFQLIFAEAFTPSQATGAFIGGTAGYGFLKGMQRALFSNEAGQGSAPIAHSAAKTNEPVREGVVAGLEPFIDTIVVCTVTALVILLSGAWNRAPGLSFVDGPPQIVEVGQLDGQTAWSVSTARVEVADAIETGSQMQENTGVFVVVKGGLNGETGGDHHRVSGVLRHDAAGWTAVFNGNTAANGDTYAFTAPAGDTAWTIAQPGVYFGYTGATLTAKAFDRVWPGLGKWLVPLVAFLFAFSTIISWSYYGEQGVVYLFGEAATMPYRIVYSLLVVVACVPTFVRTEAQLDMLSTLGTGVMLWANIPIMLIFGPTAMRAYKDYMRRLDAGQMVGHAYPPIMDVVDGDDVS